MARNLTTRDDNTNESILTVAKELQKLQEENAKNLAAYEYRLKAKNEDKLYKEYRLKGITDVAKAQKKMDEELANNMKARRLEMIQAGQEAWVKAAEAAGKSIEEATKQYKEEIKEYRKEALKTSNQEALAQKYGIDMKAIADGTSSALGEGMKAAVNALSSAADKVVGDALSIYKDYADKVNTRLIGVSKTFKNISDQTTKFTGLYDNKDYLRNVAELVESGVVQNVEQRAFLATLRDDLVTTFDANNATLERLIRIQEEDSTASRMGMEGYLNEFLNSNYKNTEYLTDLFDQVSGNIEEATSLLTSADAVSTEYAIQKWLGALYSKGMSQTGITAIATALGQLGSGNVNDLVGSNIGNLMAMSSNGNYGNYLKRGLSEATVNIIMENLVNYLQQLNDNSNNVARSQIAKTFGMSISDLRAAANIDTSTLSGTLSASQATGYLGNLLGTVSSRMTMAEKMENFMNNLSFAFGSQIVESSMMYALYKAGDIANAILPVNIEVAPFGIGVSAKIGDLLKMGSMLGGVVGLIGDLMGGAPAISSLVSTYNRLGSSSVTAGNGLSVEGSGISESGFIGNGEGSDIYKKSLTDASNSAGDIDTTTGQNEDDIDVVVPNIYKYLINTFDGKMDTILSLTASIANYSVVDSFGNTMNANMNTIIGGTTATVTAKPAETSVNDAIIQTSTDVNAILELLKTVIQFGTVNVTPTGAVGAAVKQTAANVWGGITLSQG